MMIPEWFYSRKSHKQDKLKRGLRDRNITPVFVPVYLDMIYSPINCLKRVPEKLARYFQEHSSPGHLEHEVINIIHRED